MVVHSKDGLDELSIADDTYVAELKNGEVLTYTVNPIDVGLSVGSLDDITADDADDSLTIIRAAFAGKQGSAKDIVALNAGAAIYVSGLADSLKAGVEKAKQVLENGGAQRKLEEYVVASNQ